MRLEAVGKSLSCRSEAEVREGHGGIKHDAAFHGRTERGVMTPVGRDERARLGGIDVALRIAAQEAGITNYSIVAYPKQKDAVTELMEMLNTEALEAHLQNQSIAKYYKQMEQISNMEPLQARLPYFIEF